MPEPVPLRSGRGAELGWAFRNSDRRFGFVVVQPALSWVAGEHFDRGRLRPTAHTQDPFFWAEVVEDASATVLAHSFGCPIVRFQNSSCWAERPKAPRVSLSVHTDRAGEAEGVVQRALHGPRARSAAHCSKTAG